MLKEAPPIPDLGLVGEKDRAKDSNILFMVNQCNLMAYISCDDLSGDYRLLCKFLANLLDKTLGQGRADDPDIGSILETNGLLDFIWYLCCVREWDGRCEGFNDLGASLKNDLYELVVKEKAQDAQPNMPVNIPQGGSQDAIMEEAVAELNEVDCGSHYVRDKALGCDQDEPFNVYNAVTLGKEWVALGAY